MGRARIALLLLVAAAAAAFFTFGGHDLLRPENLQGLFARAQEFYKANPLQAGLGFFAVYVAVTALSLPGAAVMTLVGGAVFGLLWGIVVVSFASTIGATLAFLASRFLLRDWVQARFADRLKAINAG